MKQKWLPLLLVLALMISMLAACGSQSAAEAGEQSAPSEQTETAEDTQEAGQAGQAGEPDATEAEDAEETEASAEELPAEPEKELTGDEALDYDWGEYTADLPLTDELVIFSYWMGTTISTASSDPVLACRYLDYLYTYDGFILSNYGEEGVALECDENGVPNLTDLVIRNENFITPVGFILYTKFSGAGICDNRRSTLL